MSKTEQILKMYFCHPHRIRAVINLFLTLSYANLLTKEEKEQVIKIQEEITPLLDRLDELKGKEKLSLPEHGEKMELIKQIASLQEEIKAATPNMPGKDKDFVIASESLIKQQIKATGLEKSVNWKLMYRRKKHKKRLDKEKKQNELLNKARIQGGINGF